MRSRLRQSAFTLVEMILVIVLLGIVSGILAPIITQNIRAYSDTKARNEMMARGRIALGRLGRELRNAIPYSIVVSGTTLKFVTAVNGGRYLERGENPPRIANGDCAQNSERFYTSAAADTLSALCLFSSTAIAAPGADNDLALVIGNNSSASLYSYSDPGTWIGLSAAIPPIQLPDPDYSGAVWKLTFSTPHSFNQASIYKNYQIADFTHQVEFSTDQILWRRSAGISDPSGGTTALLINGVSSLNFDTSQLASGILRVSIGLLENGETLTMVEDIYVRNTP